MSSASYVIQGGDYENGGAASGKLKDVLKKVGVSPEIIRRAMIAAYEAEMNVVIHASRGAMRIALDDGRLAVEVEDEGPGIGDLELAMKEGYSTAPPRARELGFGAGLGLPNIRRNSDDFTVESSPGKGTRLRFAIALRPQSRAAARLRNSVRVQSGRCIECRRCLAACPTAAVRVHGARPLVLDHLCVDCTACLSACPRGALAMDVGGESSTAGEGAALIAPAALFGQFGGAAGFAEIGAALRARGFTEVCVLEAWAEGVREAALREAQTGSRALPVIAPVCPAVMNLIELRFPSLLGHVTAVLSPLEAAAREMSDARCVFIAACPAQRTLLSARRWVTPAALRRALPPFADRPRPEASGVVAETADPTGVLRVYGMDHVTAALNRIEDGLLADVPVAEMFACTAGCFGSPLMAEDPYIARARWRRMPTPAARPAVARPEALAPREGVRLAADMADAIERLRRIAAERRRLPGRDCGQCGAPTCDDFAEDVVLGRGVQTECPYASK